MNQIHYRAEDILKKQFKKRFRGYSPLEVDTFLDNIIKDYETYSKELASLKEENAFLNDTIKKLKKNERNNSCEQIKISKEKLMTKFDISKRLSNLEKKVFGKKLNFKKHIKNSAMMKYLHKDLDK